MPRPRAKEPYIARTFGIPYTLLFRIQKEMKKLQMKSRSQYVSGILKQYFEFVDGKRDRFDTPSSADGKAKPQENAGELEE
jgi:hypothetical protein